VEFGCGACGRASHARTREVGGHRPGPTTGSAGNGWTGAGEGRRKPVRNEGLSLVLPSTRKRGPSNRKAAMARRKAMRGPQGLSQAGAKRENDQVAPFGASSPSLMRGKTGPPALRRGRDTDGAWAQRFFQGMTCCLTVEAVSERARDSACVAQCSHTTLRCHPRLVRRRRTRGGDPYTRAEIVRARTSQPSSRTTNSEVMGPRLRGDDDGVCGGFAHKTTCAPRSSDGTAFPLR
jgi:hypothetical protein